MHYILRSILPITLAVFVLAPNSWAGKGNPSDKVDINYTEKSNGLIKLRFTQGGFDNGGMIEAKMWGRDLNHDGVLYSMSGFLASILPNAMGPGNEFMRVEVTFKNFFGVPSFTQVWDEREAPILQDAGFDPTIFFGFAYNLDGGKIGDDPNEGFSFSPLSPSVAYTMGELFQDILGPGFTQLFTCGNEDSVCGAVTQIRPVGGFPGYEFVSEAYSNDEIDVTRLTKQQPKVCEVGSTI